MSRGRDSGFTLIEALAALAVSAAIVAALATLAGQWLPHWRHGFLILQTVDAVGLALDRISGDIASAEYARLDGGQGTPLFRGEPGAVAYVRQAVGPGAGPRLEIVRIGETQAAAGLDVERAHAAFAPGVAPAFRDPVTLLRPPFRLGFAYAGPDGQWRSQWTGEAKLPRRVRLQVFAGAALVASTAVALKVTAAPELTAQPESQPGSAPGAGEER